MVDKFIDTKKRYVKHLKNGKNKDIISDDEFEELVDKVDKECKQSDILNIQKNKIK